MQLLWTGQPGKIERKGDGKGLAMCQISLERTVRNSGIEKDKYIMPLRL